MKHEFRSKGPELLSDLMVHLITILKEQGVEADIAQRAAQEAATRMAGHWGGQLIYFPIGHSYNLSKRDRAIFEEFNGHNQPDLARKYGVSLQWVYKIIEKIRQEEISLRQGDMFK
ncbi:MAG: Mor transcription activator family protein [Pseudomonadota bacterium]